MQTSQGIKDYEPRQNQTNPISPNENLQTQMQGRHTTKDLEKTTDEGL